MRLKAVLRDSIEDLIDDLAEQYPRHDVQTLLADVLYSNVIRVEITDQMDFAVERLAAEDVA